MLFGGLFPVIGGLYQYGLYTYLEGGVFALLLTFPLKEYNIRDGRGILTQLVTNVLGDLGGMLGDLFVTYGIQDGATFIAC